KRISIPTKSSLSSSNMLFSILFLYIYFFVGIVIDFPILLSLPKNELVFFPKNKKKNTAKSQD
ncbi:MAG: hypothetical protein ACLUHI_10300, partial [Streptococcus salivarius]